MNKLGTVLMLLLALCGAAPAQNAAKIQGAPFIYLTVQDAINASVHGNVIQVREGDHYESLIISNKNIAVEGGYDATFTSRTGAESVINAAKAGTTLWVMDSSTRVDRVHFTGGVGWPANLWVGGGILLHRSWAELLDCTVYSNTASAGGGVFVDLFSYAKMTGGSEVYSNLAVFSGGGCFVDGRLDIVHSNVMVHGNVAAEGNGGGIWVETGYLRLFQGKVFENEAQPGAGGISAAGGGIGAAESFVEVGDGAEIFENQAIVGGGVALFNSTGNLGRARSMDCNICANTAQDAGGGLYATNSSVLFRGGHFWSNHAHTNGGGIWMNTCRSECDTNGLTVWQGTAGQHGGGVYLENSTSRFNRLLCGMEHGGNQAVSSGGGLFVRDSYVELAGGAFLNNYADNPASANSGGAIYAQRTHLLITNGMGYEDEWTIPLFANNRASTNHGEGGAIWISLGSTAEVWSAIFTNNMAYRGGALSTWDADAWLVGCRFLGNRAREGGALYLDVASDTRGGNCLFEGNQADLDGGAVYAYQASMDMPNSHFIANVASNYGGALYGYDADIALYADAPFYSATNGWPLTFRENTAHNSAGVAYLNRSRTFIYHAAVQDNSASAYASGIMIANGSLWMGNSLITGGRSPGGFGAGAGLALAAFATGHLFTTTIADNGGDGLRLYGCTVSITNCIIWGNPTGNIDTNNASGTPLDVAYSCIGGGWPGVGNLDEFPEFYPNYHLRYGSPCINAGAPIQSMIPFDYFDMDGEMRTNTLCDMGCDEFQDSDQDRMPDLVETHTGVYADELDMGTNPHDPDSDGDAMQDGDEWVADTNPTRADDYLRILSIIPVHPDQAQVTWAGGTQADQEVDGTELLSPTWQTGLAHITAPTQPTNQAVIALADHTNWCFRVRAYRP